MTQQLTDRELLRDLHRNMWEQAKYMVELARDMRRQIAEARGQAAAIGRAM